MTKICYKLAHLSDASCSASHLNKESIVLYNYDAWGGQNWFKSELWFFWNYIMSSTCYPKSPWMPPSEIWKSQDGARWRRAINPKNWSGYILPSKRARVVILVSRHRFLGSKFPFLIVLFISNIYFSRWRPSHIGSHLETEIFWINEIIKK